MKELESREKNHAVFFFYLLHANNVGLAVTGCRVTLTPHYDMSSCEMTIHITII